MTKEQKAVLSLIRAVASGAHDVRLTADICWVKVMEEATRQRVQGLCFDALELLPAEDRPDKAILLDWLGQVVGMERLYESHRKTIDALSCFYQQNGIRMMLLKGYGLSLYLPKRVKNMVYSIVLLNITKKS